MRSRNSASDKSVAQHAAELRRAGAFLAGGRQQDRAARFHDMGGGGHALDRLVVRQVERVAGGGGDRGVDGLVEGFQHHLRDELDAGAVRLLRVSGEDAGDRAVAGQRHVQQEIVAGHAGDLEQFAMQRVVLDGAFDGARVAHELRAVQDLDGLLRGESGRDQLAAAGVAQHQVRLDKPERDVQVGGDEALVDVGPACRSA